MFPQSDVLFIMPSPLEFYFVYHPPLCIILHSVQCYTVVSGLCCAVLQKSVMHWVSPCVHHTHHCCKSGSQPDNLPPERRIDEWWDLEDTRNKKEGQCYDSEQQFYLKNGFENCLKKKKKEKVKGEGRRERGVKCYKDIIMNGDEREVSEQVKDGERPSELWERQREWEGGEREKECSETDRMSYRPREGERAFTHGDSRVI